MKSPGLIISTLSHNNRAKRAFRQPVHTASPSLKVVDTIHSWPSETSSSSDNHESNDAVDDRFFESNMCRSSGCFKHVDAKILCVAHGGSRPCRESLTCTCSVGSQHGGGRKCNHKGCKKHVASSGLCRTHGGGRRCQVPDCMSSAQSRGLCYVHGGGGRCQREGCGSSAKKGGFCIAHGGGHRCEVVGCTSSAVSGARCRAHGGGRRCAIEDCTSSAKTGGRCIAHGGGKRCTVNGCTSSAQRLGLCKAHGGGRRCIVDNCANSAVSRGRCIAHGGGKRCSFEGCTTTARKGGFCFAHGGRSTSSMTTSRSKVTSPTLSRTPASMSKSRPVEERSISALNLPPRRQLPPIDAMLKANQSDILQCDTLIPPIRRPVESFQNQSSHEQGNSDRDWQSPNSVCPPATSPSQHRRLQTATPSSTHSGYSWQRLQETIRRESRVHGITNDDDESMYEERVNGKVDGNETEDSNWVRNRVPILSKTTRQI